MPDFKSSLTLNGVGVSLAGHTHSGIGFQAYLSAIQYSVATASWTKLAFNTEQFDVGNYFDTAAYRYTPQFAGKYLVSLHVTIPTSVLSARLAIDVYKNGSSYLRISDGIYPAGVGSAIVPLNGSTDYIEAYVYQTFEPSAMIHPALYYTSFSAWWIG
jgi:hypothetical protein